MKNKISILFFVGALILVLLIFSGWECQKSISLQEKTEEAKEIPEEIVEQAEEEIPEEIKIGSVEHKLEDLETMQKSVDEGHQPWRLDPYHVASSESVELGFDQQKDSFTLTSKVEMGEYSGTGEATVEAIHNEVAYVIQLIQPVKQGVGGIWVINSVLRK